MSILTEAQAKAILDKVIAFSTADECSAQIDGGSQGNVRFARNDISTSGIVDNVQLGVQVAFGKMTGAAIPARDSDARLQRSTATGAGATTGAAIVAARAGRGCQMMWGRVIAIARA